MANVGRAIAEGLGWSWRQPHRGCDQADTSLGNVRLTRPGRVTELQL
jgi:hypothetical protein